MTEAEYIEQIDRLYDQVHRIRGRIDLARAQGPLSIDHAARAFAAILMIVEEIEKLPDSVKDDKGEE